MNRELAASYELCRQTARRAASNFYYSFRLLPQSLRPAMWALYAFMRRTDDLGDSDQSVDRRRAALGAWRDQFHAALDGRVGEPMLVAVADTVARYQIPPQHLEAAIDGVEMDLAEVRFGTFAQLEAYCERVASAVGLACLHVWGFRGAGALEPARQCGIAFQLTNILRDLGEDAARGRIYLPLEDLARFGYTEAELLAGRCTIRFRELVRFEIARAEQFYRQGAELAAYLAPPGRRIFAAMWSTYHGLLEKIKRHDGDVWTRRIRLGRWQKLRIAARALLARPGP